MGDKMEYAKRNGIILSIAVSVVTLAILSLGQLRILSSFGVVYEETTDQIKSDQAVTDRDQDKVMHEVSEDLDAHSDLPGHGVGLADSRNMKEKVDDIDKKVEQMDRAVRDLTSVTIQLKTEVQGMRREMNNRE